MSTTETLGLQDAVEELRRVEAELGKRSFYNYFRMMWHVVEPDTPFIDSWHIGAICEHEQAVHEGQILKLLINICPRSSKSICTSVAFPTWVWTNRASVRFLCASYESGLSLELATTSRSVIESKWYQDRWPLELRADQNNKGFYQNEERGYRISVSVGGSSVGKGGDILIADDPHNLETIHSDVVRERDKTWFWKIWSQRANNKKRDRQIVIMQRGHQEDLSNDLEQHEEWTILKLPTEYHPRKWTSPIGWSDPRTKEGELLCPERLGPEELETVKKELGPVDYSCQHDQDPVPETGGMFERQWFEIVEKLPEGEHITWVRFWDIAGTEDETAAYTAGVRMGKSKSGVFYISDVQRDRLVAAKVDALMLQTAKTDGVSVSIIEEQEPGSAGKAVIAARKNLLSGYDYKGIPASGEKSIRWRPLSSQARPASDKEVYGNVKLLSGDWNKALLDELVANLRSKFKDQLDAASGALHELTIGMKPVRKRIAKWG